MIVVCPVPLLSSGLDWTMTESWMVAAKAGNKTKVHEVELCSFGWNKKNSSSCLLKAPTVCHELHIR